MNTIGQVISKGRPDIMRIKLPPAPEKDEWVSAREAAHRAGMEHVTVWNWAKRGIVPHRRAGRLVLVPAGRVAQLAEVWHKHGARSRWLFRTGDPDHAYIPITRE